MGETLRTVGSGKTGEHDTAGERDGAPRGQPRQRQGSREQDEPGPVQQTAAHSSSRLQRPRRPLTQEEDGRCSPPASRAPQSLPHPEPVGESSDGTCSCVSWGTWAAVLGDAHRGCPEVLEAPRLGTPAGWVATGPEASTRVDGVASPPVLHAAGETPQAGAHPRSQADELPETGKAMLHRKENRARTTRGLAWGRLLPAKSFRKAWDVKGAGDSSAGRPAPAGCTHAQGSRRGSWGQGLGNTCPRGDPSHQAGQAPRSLRQATLTDQPG